MTTRLLLVRHGETDGNRDRRTQGRRDVPLNATGRRQVAARAESLRGHALAAVVSSPAMRCRDTALAIAAPHGLAVEEDPRLLELDQGEMDGLTGEEMRARYPDVLRGWTGDDPRDVRLPGGETLGEAQARMVEAALAIAATRPGDEVVVVSHNLALKVLLCHALGAPIAAFRRLRLDLASLTTVDVRLDAPWTVLEVNERCDLP